ncbi:MAG: hypothetical protein IT287_00715 [Bdellovibrionaceae bacterium]|nr:hypothetical protein [Pseudobdellovibrionaceae bacterium]
MSLFSKGTATAYTPVDLAVERQKEKEDTQFEISKFFLDTAEFKIDPQVANQMGLTFARNKEEKRVFDAEVLKFVQSIKDDAYTVAYNEGREEGIKIAKIEALALAKAEIQNKLVSLLEMTQSLDNHRQKMYEENETEIVRFCYFLAHKILLKEVKVNKEYILEIIKKMIPSDESCTIRLNTNDHAFIQTHLNLLEKDFNMQAIKFEVDDNLQEGDVIAETQNGILDGTLNTRLEKLKKSLEQME